MTSDSIASLEARARVGFAKYFAEAEAHEATRQRLHRVNEALVVLAVLVLQHDKRAEPSARFIIEHRSPQTVREISYRVRQGRRRGRKP